MSNVTPHKSFDERNSLRNELKNGSIEFHCNVNLTKSDLFWNLYIVGKWHPSENEIEINLTFIKHLRFHVNDCW